ncbi:MAG: MMPL family transporter [Planctomycetes bacterium]|nr:MMPL family transporter [Planctomycetota bacterium]
MLLSRRTTLLLGLLLLAALATPIVRRLSSLELDASTRVLLAGDERSSTSYKQLEGYLGGRALVAVVLGHDALFSNAGMHAVRVLSARLDNLPGMRDVKSITRLDHPVLRGGFSWNPTGMIELEPLVPEGRLDDATWAALERRALDDPLARDLLVSSDGLYAMVLGVADRPLRTHADKLALRADVQRVVDEVAALPGVRETHVLSFPFIEVEMREAVEHDLLGFVAALFALVTIVLLLTYRSLVVLVWMLALELAGVGTLPLLLTYDGTSVNLFTSLLFPLVAGLQLTFLTHLFSALQRASRGRRFADALVAALRQVTLPSAVAAATTVLGMLALLVCDVPSVRDFGRLGAQAVVAVFAVTFVPAWMLRLLVRKRVTASAREAGDDLDPPHAPHEVPLARLVDALTGRPGLVAGIAGVLLLCCVPAVLELRSDVRAVEFLAPSSPTRRALDVLDTHLGGVNVLEIGVDAGETGGLAHPETLRFLERVRAYALQQPGVTSVYSYSLLFCVLNRIWMHDAPGSFALPDDPYLTGLFALAIARRDFPLDEALQDADARRSTIVLRTRDMPSRDYLRIVEDVLAYADAERPPGVRLDAQEGMHTIMASDRRIVAGQLQSLLTGALAVFVALLLIWRSLRMALLVILANLPAVAVILALFGYADLPLNAITVMVGAIVLGIAVDDSIHLLTYYRGVRLRSPSRRAAIVASLRAKLQPMAATSAILSGGLGLMALSSFPPVVHFGVASSLALLVALISTAFLLPALLELVFRKAPMR